MLTFFQVEKRFYSTVVRLYVDVDKQEADLTVTYQRRIMRQEKLGIDQNISRFGQNSWVKLTDVAGAEAFLSRDTGEHGSLIEYLDWACRRGLIAA